MNAMTLLFRSIPLLVGANHRARCAHTVPHLAHLTCSYRTEQPMNNQLDDILNAFEEALECWGLALSGSSDGLSAIRPATVEQPLNELNKVVKLIKAHTTKVGIIFEPTKLVKQSEAAYSTLSDLSKSIVLFMSIVAQLTPEKISSLFYKEIVSVSHILIESTTSLASELKKLRNDTRDGIDATLTDIKTTSTDLRLVSVGKIWSVCDDLVKLVEEGNLKFLEKKTRVQLSLLDDGLDEFAEWAENPEDFEDPFGLDEFSDEEADEGGFADSNSESDTEESSEDLVKKKEELASYAKQWVQKFKLVKLLFLSINKSLPSIIKGSYIDEIYKTESDICKESDLLIVELMMNRSLLEDVQEHAVAVDKACFKILAIVKNANRNNDKKIKWCGSWESKYKEILGTMYN